MCEDLARILATTHKGAGLPVLAEIMVNSLYPGLRNKAAQFTDYTGEIKSIASAAKIQTEAFDDIEIARDLAQDGFDFRELKRRPVTVYLVLPPDKVERHSKWLRLVLTAAIHAVMSPRERGAPKVIFMLDEFFALGHLEIDVLERNDGFLAAGVGFVQSPDDDDVLGWNRRHRALSLPIASAAA